MTPNQTTPPNERDTDPRFVQLGNGCREARVLTLDLDPQDPNDA